MKQKILLLTTLLLSVFSYAQDIPVKVQKSNVFKDEYKHSSIVLTEDDGNGGVIMVRSYYGGGFSSGAGYYFEHYDSDLNLIKEYEYELSKLKFFSHNSAMGVIMSGQDVHIIGFEYQKSEKAYICSALSANISDFNFTRSELFRINSEEIKRFGFFSMNQYDGDSGASMIVNEDRTAFAITVDIADRNSETHKVYLFDNTLNKHIEHTFKRNIKDKKFRYENIDVSKDGKSLYLLGKVYTNEAKKKKEGGKYQYELTKITSDSEKTQVFDTKQNFAGSLKTIVLDGRLACVGLYSEYRDARYKGICYFELNPETLDIKTSKFNPFTEQFLIDKYGKNKQKELALLSFRNIIVTENQDIIFNAEEFYTLTHMNRGPNGIVTYSYTYHYDDIVSAKLNSSGEMVWARNINKRQFTSGDESYISYTSTAKGGDAYFFINTKDKIKKLKNDRIQFGQTTKGKSNLNVIRINEKGDFDYSEVLNDKDNEVPFMVAYGVQSGDSVFFLGRKGKKKQILKLTL
ncbi:MAG: hypothetical protein WCY89_06820 [Flavobacteriaceae bacterium]